MNQYKVGRETDGAFLDMLTLDLNTSVLTENDVM